MEILAKKGRAGRDYTGIGGTAVVTQPAVPDGARTRTHLGLRRPSGIPALEIAANVDGAENGME